jgi:hypothetical protein
MPKTQGSRKPLTRDSLSKVIAAIKRGVTCAEINAKGLAVKVDGSKGLSTTGYDYYIRKLGLKAPVKEKADTRTLVFVDVETDKVIRNISDLITGNTYIVFEMAQKGGTR